jgi:NAD(P)-dependent dehydrogenase (short-subunit alcohol dehydrogenase family)
MTHLVILTGTSRGLGLAMAQQFLMRSGTLLLGLSRKPSEALGRSPRADGSTLEQWPLDLADPRFAAAKLETWLQARDASAIDTATLINNAALLTPPGPVEACDATLLSDSLRVGLEAPMLLCAAFLRATSAWRAGKKILNISSGLGRRAMAGSAPYCAAKAGLDNFSRAIALDEALKRNGAKVVSLAPGVIDTDMQTQLRSADGRAFPDKAMFVGLKTGGQLASPEHAATRVIAYLDRADFGSNPLADVRDA